MMTDADKVGFVAALAELASLKPGANLTPEAYAAWWNAMRGTWTLDEFRAACAHLRDTEEFFPNPYHFTRLRRATIEDQAPDAWAEVLTCVRSGAHRAGQTPGGKTDRVVAAMGGYYNLGMTPTTDLAWREKRFREIWAEISEANEARAALPHMASAPRIARGGMKPLAELLPTLKRGSP